MGCQETTELKIVNNVDIEDSDIMDVTYEEIRDQLNATHIANLNNIPYKIDDIHHIILIIIFFINPIKTLQL